ncbi:peptidase [Haemophilus sputorum]|uniref:Peptidase n=1 Tax=Haemophilus sputorum TaxID=1078480 RepID=A0ABX9HQS4_9PAST|nr:peptidase [Haemophilus sputorum]RDF07421.1 peptidase [Haemophilus sputorum]RDF11103.1 peptidase [Haemophilus sputorum]
MKLIEIFKAGECKDANGVKVTITPDDLQQVVDSYDANVFEAPAVIGHPEHNHPAYAWVKGLRLEGDVLKAELHQVDPAFSELVEKGRYKKISASFYLPNSESNPKKGFLYLRHVGFLGAAAPAVKGLKTPIFAENESGVVDFSDYIDKKSLELEELKAENARLKEQMAEKLAQDKKKEIVYFTENLIKQGRLAPRVRNEIEAILHYAERIDKGETLDFSEGESLLKKMQDFLLAQPQIITFSEVATKENAVSKTEEDFIQYAENTPPEMIELDQKIRTYAKVNKISYTEAFDIICKPRGK